MNRIKSWLQRVFFRAYGFDPLGKVLLITAVGFMMAGALVSFFGGTGRVRLLFCVFELTAILWFVFRFFSVNHAGRRKENAVWLKLSGKVHSYFLLQKDRFRDRKTAIYRKCPACGATLKLPKRKGKHTACCPRCKNRFEVRIL